MVCCIHLKKEISPTTSNWLFSSSFQKDRIGHFRYMWNYVYIIRLQKESLMWKTRMAPGERRPQLWCIHMLLGRSHFQSWHQQRCFKEVFDLIYIHLPCFCLTWHHLNMSCTKMFPDYKIWDHLQNVMGCSLANSTTFLQISWESDL